MDNKLGLRSTIVGERLGDSELLNNLTMSLEKPSRINTAFSWVSSPLGHGFWYKYYEEGTAEGKSELHKMIRALTYTKPFNRKDWL